MELDQAPGIRPSPTLRRRLDIAGRRAFPLASALLLMVVCNAPLQLPLQPVLLPTLAVTSVFFWSIYRPASLPPPAVFLLGITLDLLGWFPLGAGTISLLAVQAACLRWRRLLARQSFALVWGVFIVFASAASLAIWAACSLLVLRLLPIEPAILQSLLSAALYPAIAIPFTRAHRTIANPGFA